MDCSPIPRAPVGATSFGGAASGGNSVWRLAFGDQSPCGVGHSASVGGVHRRQLRAASKLCTFGRDKSRPELAVAARTLRSPCRAPHKVQPTGIDRPKTVACGRAAPTPTPTRGKNPPNAPERDQPRRRPFKAPDKRAAIPPPPTHRSARRPPAFRGRCRHRCPAPTKGIGCRGKLCRSHRRH